RPDDRRRPLVRPGAGRNVRGHGLRGPGRTRPDLLPGLRPGGFGHPEVGGPPRPRTAPLPLTARALCIPLPAVNRRPPADAERPAKIGTTSPPAGTMSVKRHSRGGDRHGDRAGRPDPPAPPERARRRGDQGADRRPAPPALRRGPRGDGVRRPDAAARPTGLGRLPAPPAPRARRRGRLPGDVPGPGPPGRV